MDTTARKTTLTNHITGRSAISHRDFTPIVMLSDSHYMNSRGLAAHFDAQYAAFKAILTDLGLAQ